MDYVFNHYFDSLFCSKVDPEKLKEYTKRKAAEDLAKLLMEKPRLRRLRGTTVLLLRLAFERRKK